MAYAAEFYMHDLDKRAFDALNQFPKFIKLQKAYIENVDEKNAKISQLSTAIRLGEKQYGEIYSLFPSICEKLGIDIPEVYMVKSRDKKDINAYTIGITVPIVCITSELIETFSLDMISSVIAHECGHIACKHYLYHSLAMNFINGIDASPLNKIPAIKNCLNKTLVKSLLFWDRCSELSADRAAVLCDGNSEETIKTLLKIHGFNENVNIKEYIKQSLDLRDFVNDSKDNKMMELMITQWNSHPLMATRAYECYEFENSKKYRQILDGSFNIAEKKDIMETEYINAEIMLDKAGEAEVIDIDAKLKDLNDELDRYTCKADKSDYAFAIGSGLVWSVCDSLILSDITIYNKDIGISHENVNRLIGKVAKYYGCDSNRLNKQIEFLEKAFKVPNDAAYVNIPGISHKEHHLADLAHHPTPIGLIASIIAQMLRIGIFVNNDGDIHFKLLKVSDEEIKNGLIKERIIATILTGILNWIVDIAENKYEEDNEEEIPEAIKKLSHLIASTPEIIEIVKCANNWIGHIVSDMGGSKSTAGHGMGVPGVFISLLYEISSIPPFNKSGLLDFLNNLYVKNKLDLRKELAMSANLSMLKDQSITVALNEITIRLAFMLGRLCDEITDNGIKNINWNNVMPFNNRTLDRMLMISFMAFNVVDITDSAVRAAIESRCNLALFSSKFVARYNLVGAGRVALTIVKEVSNEKKETELIHEKMLLMNVKAHNMMQQVQEFSDKLEEKLANYLVEDITYFIEGFDYINEGIKHNDSAAVIKGNVIIQKVLGREPQFVTQKEFDELMESDEPLQL